MSPRGVVIATRLSSLNLSTPLAAQYHPAENRTIVHTTRAQRAEEVPPGNRSGIRHSRRMNQVRQVAKCDTPLYGLAMSQETAVRRATMPAKRPKPTKKSRPGLLFSNQPKSATAKAAPIDKQIGWTCGRRLLP